MAAFREHVTFSTLIGVGYGVVASTVLGFTPTQGILAATLTGMAGMLPDIDLSTGRPGREIFSAVAAIAPMFLVNHVLRWLNLPYDTETILLSLIVLYLAIRFGVSEMVNKLSVHRGMFHSIPAMFIAADVAFLGYPGPDLRSKILIATGVAIGFLSHLILDEIYSVELSGVKVRLKKSAGSALKIAGTAFVPNVVTFALFCTLNFAVLSQMGILDPPTIQARTRTEPASAPADLAVTEPQQTNVAPPVEGFPGWEVQPASGSNPAHQPWTTPTNNYQPNNSQQYSQPNSYWQQPSGSKPQQRLESAPPLQQAADFNRSPF